MLRRFTAALALLVLGVGVLVAAEWKARVVQVDPDQKVLVVQKEEDNKEHKLKIGKQARLVGADGKEITIADLKKDSQVKVTTEEVEKDGKKRQRVTEVKVIK